MDNNNSRSPKSHPEDFSCDRAVYQKTLDYLYTQTPAYQKIGGAAYKPGLENSRKLDVYFGTPHRKYKTIHVAGTNGKGSTSHLLAAVLQESGYKTGLYTSPHLIDFSERIRVNGRTIDRKYVVEFVEKHKASFEPIQPSFFELTMEMAFCYFADCGVDVAIVETGLGGRLDSTNIVCPDLCVITNIGLEHTQYLGDTLPKIATEKAGIIKPYTPVIIGEVDNDEVRQVFIDKSQEMNAPIVFAENALPLFSAHRKDDKWVFATCEYAGLKGGLNGFAQEKNARTVLAALKELKKIGYRISEKAIYSGFENVVKLTGLMGRWQTLQERPKIVCDTGHNAHGMRDIVRQLVSEKYKQLHVVFGLVNDKDIASILRLLPRDARYYFTRPSVDRAMDERLLARDARRMGLKGDVYRTVGSAVEAAQKTADKEDFIFIGGSSFVVADALLLDIYQSITT